MEISTEVALLYPNPPNLRQRGDRQFWRNVEGGALVKGEALISCGGNLFRTLGEKERARHA